MILLFGLDEHPLFGTVAMLSTMCGQEIRKVALSEAKKPLKELLSGKTEPLPLGASVPKGFPAAPAFADPVIGSVPEDPLILFAGMNQEEVSAFVDQLKTLSGGTSSRILKAVITPTNIEWSIFYLLEHLKEERAYFQQRSSKS
ncbi:MAG: DUF3783 domain-containing protein [Firmicutes bacterium]|nr:DUF3783 domain-containing protein [Bacillota bacterium]